RFLGKIKGKIESEHAAKSQRQHQHHETNAAPEPPAAHMSSQTRKFAEKGCRQVGHRVFLCVLDRNNGGRTAARAAAAAPWRATRHSYLWYQGDGNCASSFLGSRARSKRWR